MSTKARSNKSAGQRAIKKYGERIQMLEERPRNEWFVKVKASDGEIQWFVRLSITGLSVRRYGPFPHKRAGLLFLDAAINVLIDGVCEVDAVQAKYRLPNRPFRNHGGQYPILERELVLQAGTLGKERSTVVNRRKRQNKTKDAA